MAHPMSPAGVKMGHSLDLELAALAAPTLAALAAQAAPTLAALTALTLAALAALTLAALAALAALVGARPGQGAT